MVRTRYYVTGDPVPVYGTYTTFCDNVLQQLDETQTFPPCPRCLLAASWRSTNPISEAEEAVAPQRKAASRKA